MIDFSRRDLFELNGAICEMGPLFEVAYSVEWLSRNGSYLAAHQVVDQFLQEVGDDQEQYLPLAKLLRERIDESQKVLEEIAQ